MLERLLGHPRSARQQLVDREGSPPYTWNFPATGPGASASIYADTQFPASRKYSPLDCLEVVNNETSIDLLLTINGNETYVVPAATIRQVRDTPMRHITLSNRSGVHTTTLYKVVVTVLREPWTADKEARSKR